jgi:acyl-coenzyme A synthetase/AMP-(fatty) acid ligase/thioesterase domain-containing protein
MSVHQPAREFTNDTIWSCFENLAARYSERPALLVGERTLTYQELAALARERQRLLERLEPGNDPVGIRGPVNEVAVSTMLALAALGRPFVFLDPDWSSERSAQVLRVARPAAIVEDQAGHGDPKSDLTASTVSAAPSASVLAAPDSLFCLVSTSGSVAEPRFLAYEQTAVLANLRNYGLSFELNPEDRVAVTASPAYGPFLAQLFGALLHGACALPFELARQSLADMPGWLARRRVSKLHLVPSVFRRLAGHLLRSNHSLPELRMLRLGGEPLAWTDLDLARRALPDNVRVLNGYAISEACGNITTCELSSDLKARAGGVPVGRPSPGREVRIVDESGNCLPPGESGRILVRCRHLARGYLGDPAAWAELVRPTPEGGFELWTGDLGRLDESGVLTLLGRLDRSAKVMGRWLDLGQAEGALSGLPEVALAHALCRGGDTMAVFIELRHGQLPRETFWRKCLAETLGMELPWRFIFLPSLPQGPGGKLDSASLSRMLDDDSALETPLAEDSLAGLLATTLSEVLQRPVSVADSFFAAGGSSLSAVEWTTLLLRRHSVKLPLASLAGSPSLRELARELHFPPARLHRLKGEGSGLILVPGGSGGALEFLLLKDLIAGLALSVQGLDASVDQEFTTLDALCDRLLPELCARNGREDLLLLGWCSGARLAVELAQLWLDSGATARVILVDPLLPDEDPSAVQARRRRSYLRGLRRALAGGVDHLRKLFGGPFRERTRHANHLLRAANLALRLKPWSPPNFPLAEYQDSRAAYTRAMRAPWRPYHLDADIFLTTDRWSQRAHWKSLFPPGTRFHRVNADHDDFTSTRLEVTLKSLNEILRQGPRPGGAKGGPC